MATFGILCHAELIYDGIESKGYKFYRSIYCSVVTGRPMLLTLHWHWLGWSLQKMLADDTFAPALAGMVLPEMPPELWALALGFLARRDLYASA
jgi:hypothetical protein